jgi:hypothetical protein
VARSLKPETGVLSFDGSRGTQTHMGELTIVQIERRSAGGPLKRVDPPSLRSRGLVLTHLCFGTD